MGYGIAAGHEVTAETAEIILQAGGNAIDAAIGAFIMAFVSEPCMASAAGGGFAMIREPGKNPIMLDFFCQTPCVKRPRKEEEFYPVEVDFGTTKETFHIGMGAAAVPGAIAGIFAMHDLYGSMPIKDLFQPAIQAAKEGIKVNEFQHIDFHLLSKIIKQDPRGKEIFFTDKNEIIPIGDMLFMSNLADFLEVLSIEGMEFYYKGEIAREIEKASIDRGGHLTRDDFVNYRVLINPAIHFPFKEREIFTSAYASIGGIIISYLLKLMEKSMPVCEPMSSKHLKSGLKEMMVLDALLHQPKEIVRRLKQEFGIHVPEPISDSQKWGGTTHLNVLDQDGYAVSLSCSIGEGNGFFIPGTDTQMNNMLGESALMPGGFHSWEPNVRLISMMAPSMIIHPKKDEMAILGTGGAGRIPFAISQIIMNLFHFHMDLEHALVLPRMHFSDNTIHYENGYDDSGLSEHFSQETLHWGDASMFFGGVHCVTKTANVIKAFGDPRRFGVGILG